MNLVAGKIFYKLIHIIRKYYSMNCNEMEYYFLSLYIVSKSWFHLSCICMENFMNSHKISNSEHKLSCFFSTQFLLNFSTQFFLLKFLLNILSAMSAIIHVAKIHRSSDILSVCWNMLKCWLAKSINTVCIVYINMGTHIHEKLLKQFMNM